jgi:hypothetical protein
MTGSLDTRRHSRLTQLWLRWLRWPVRLRRQMISPPPQRVTFLGCIGVAVVSADELGRKVIQDRFGDVRSNAKHS